MSMERRGTKEEMFGPEFVDLLKYIGGIRPEVPGYGKMACPYCDRRFQSHTEWDHHVEVIHNS